MPDYVYRCPNRHTREVSHPMDTDIVVNCLECGQRCWRVPQVVNVNWNGLPPSKGDVPPLARDLKRNLKRNQDEYERMHNG